MSVSLFPLRILSPQLILHKLSLISALQNRYHYNRLHIAQKLRAGARMPGFES